MAEYTITMWEQQPWVEDGTRERALAVHEGDFIIFEHPVEDEQWPCDRLCDVYAAAGLFQEAQTPFTTRTGGGARYKVDAKAGSAAYDVGGDFYDDLMCWPDQGSGSDDQTSQVGGDPLDSGSCSDDEGSASSSESTQDPGTAPPPLPEGPGVSAPIKGYIKVVKHF